MENLLNGEWNTIERTIINEEMKMKKYIMAILTATLIAVSFLASALVLRVNAADPTYWYYGKNGVLDSDYYSLYPFEKNSLTIGFSKFGELVNPYTGNGLNYSGRDPFANEGVTSAYWIQGWFLDARFNLRINGSQHLWAFATYADLSDVVGGDWKNNAASPTGAPNGGRKTSGIASTENITILYDGPRRFIAQCVTHLNATLGGLNYRVLDVIFTINFDKVKKQIVIYKDIKLTIDEKILDGPVDVQFSNRGEWDLGPSPDWKSYAHFYHQEFPTCYGADWTLSKNITREYRYYNASWQGLTTLNLNGNVTHTGYKLPVVWRSEHIRSGSEWLRAGEHYTMDYDTGVITFTPPLLNNTVLEIFFKLYKDVDPNSNNDALPHLYDVAQIISGDKKVVGYSAFWPTLSDYTVDGWDKYLQPLIVVNEEDILPVPSEPEIPFVIGEWDFMLDYDNVSTPWWGPQFRGVTVYGIVNYHNAQDLQMTPAIGNTLDTEVKYQLDEVFNPWDLTQAVHKDTWRWVEFHNVTLGEYNAAQSPTLTPLAIPLENSPVYLNLSRNWEDYCEESEKVMWNGTLKYPWRAIYAPTANPRAYELTKDSMGVGTITINATKVPAAGTQIKILYSTYTADSFTLTDYNNGGTPTTTYLNGTGINHFNNTALNYTSSSSDSTTWTDKFDADHTLGWDWTHAVTVNNVTMANTTGSLNLSGQLAFNILEIKAFKEDTTFIDLLKLGGSYDPGWQKLAQNTTYPNNIMLNLSRLSLNYTIVPPSTPNKLDLHVDNAYITLAYSIDINYYANLTYWNFTYSFTYTVTANIVEHIPGRWEWTVLGRDAETSDSLGALLVTPAFKNKQIEIGNGGEDMMFQEWGEQSIAWVMNCFGSTPGTRTDYKWATDPTSPGKRSALKDDWCHTWAVASSNMIGVGGPLANTFAYYFNDFTDAFYGLFAPELGESFTPYTPWQRKIIAASCWNVSSNHVAHGGNAYSSNGEFGYATITTYKDLNGTVGFLIWGDGPRDTYYASKFFHDEIIYELQRFPRCATSIIIEIDYDDPLHPTFTIVEVLGTISETMVYDSLYRDPCTSPYKGGIHDP